jgi:Methyltransferase domain
MPSDYWLLVIGSVLALSGGLMDATLQRSLTASTDRFELWANLVDSEGATTVAEVGVYRGAFATRMLRRIPTIERYFMIDPWRHLEDWNKPANADDATLEGVYEEALSSTAFAADRRVVLRGTTAEVIQEIPDGSLDFAYIDGDHTLRGISVDLVSVFPKVREGGFIGGDDFTPSIWQHPSQFEPTLVFPFAVYFAEAVSAPIYSMPHRQFLIEKRAGTGFEFNDLVGEYGDLGLRRQLLRRGAARRGGNRRKGDPDVS